MADVLEQSEVDALLAAVDSGQVGNDAPTQLFGVGSKPIGGNHVDVQTYDFKRPERASKDQMRALEALHEGFGRNFGAALSGYLRTIIEVNVAHIEQLTYSEFTHSLPNPTCFNLLKAEQLDGQLCLEISPLIIYPIIDRLLGGSSSELFIPQRPLTQIEQRLVQRITDRATQHLSEAWTNLTPLTFSVSDFESNPQLVQIVPPNETVVVVGFELKMGNRAGTMSLCIPYNVIEPIMGKLAAQNWFSYQKKDTGDEYLKKLTTNVTNATVEVRALLRQTTITMRDLLSLQVGDLITTAKPEAQDLLILVEGRNKFQGQVGKLRENKAVRITRHCKSGSEAAAGLGGKTPLIGTRQISRAAAVGTGRSTETIRIERKASAVKLGYFEQSSLPFTSLVFLIPLIVVYEIGTRWYASDPVSHVEQRIIAFNIMQNFFNWFGATGQYMPAAAVVGILLAFHILKNDVASARGGVLMGMSVESVMYAIPLVTMGYLFQHYLLSHPVADNWRRLLVLSIGAGIYEEMVFRLVLFHLLHMLLVDLLRVPKVRAIPLMVLISAISFSLYHYQIPWFPWLNCTGSEVFEWQSFIFRALAGIYFGMIFMWRGFGLTAGAHASYDIMIVVLRLVAQG